MTSFVVSPSGFIQFTSQFISQHINSHSLHNDVGWINAAPCTLGFWHPKNLCRIVLVLKVNRYFSHFNSLPGWRFTLLVYLGSTRRASGCLNSQFAIGELLRGAAEFTLGGQGPLLFAWVQRKHLGHPPTRIHRHHSSNSTESSCNNKLPFCQTPCTHNERQKRALETCCDTESSFVLSQFSVGLCRRTGCLQLLLRRSSCSTPSACPSLFLQCQSHYSCFKKDLSVLTMAT